MHRITGPSKRCGSSTSSSPLMLEWRAGKFVASPWPNEVGESAPFKAPARLFASDEGEAEGAGHLLQRTTFSAPGRLGVAPHRIAPGMGPTTLHNRHFHAYFHGLLRTAALEYSRFALHRSGSGSALRMGLGRLVPRVAFVCSGCAPQRGFGCLTQRVGGRS